MTNKHDNLDPLERELLELSVCERSGLFQRTPIDARALLQGPSAHRSISGASSRLRLLPVAAAVVLSVGVGSWMFQSEIARLRDGQRQGNDAALVASRSNFTQFYERFTGPQSAVVQDPGVAPANRSVDSDADGDVDLADFGAYQLAYAGETR